MNYKVKFMFSYKVNGEKFKEYVQELEKFMKKVEKLGIATTISDEMVLLDKYP